MLQSFRVISVAAIFASTIACGDGTFVALPEHNGPSQDDASQDGEIR